MIKKAISIISISAIMLPGFLSSCKKQSDVKVQSITLDKSSLTMSLHDEVLLTASVLPENAADKSVKWSSEDENIATVNEGRVKALGYGETFVLALSADGSVKAECRVNVEKNKIPDGAVDLGLPSGNLWATCNIGTKNPYRYGGFYAWGELQEKSTYSWDNYKFGLQDKITKYVYNGPGILQKEDDVANLKLGVSWYIPKLEEINELFENTDKSWEEDYLKKGIAGFIFKSKIQGYEEYSIFIPAAGNKSGDKHDFQKYNAFLWTSQNGAGFSSSDYEAQAIHLQVTGNENKVHTDRRMLKRNSGFNIRPVKRPE